MFLPFIHRLAATLASFAQRPLALEVGEAAPAPRETLVLTPSGQRLRPGEKDTAIELREQGFYEFRPADGTGAEAMVLAANVDLGESDMTPMDPQEVAAGATGRATGSDLPAATAVVTDEERERTQRLWWYLLFAGLLLIGSEPLVANAVKTRYR